MTPGGAPTVSMADLQSPSRSRRGPHPAQETPDVSAQDIRRDTTDILFLMESINAAISAIGHKQDKFMEHFEQIVMSLMDELAGASKRIDSVTSMVGDVSKSVASISGNIVDISCGVADALGTMQQLSPLLSQAIQTQNLALATATTQTQTQQLLVEQLSRANQRANQQINHENQ